MEDYKHQFVLILAGYPVEMDYFLRMNPGLPSRFPIHVDFPDYTVDQLMQIADLMVKEREYVLLPAAEMKLREQLIMEKMNQQLDFSNARFVRNTIERAIRHQAVRLIRRYDLAPPKSELMTIRPEDLRFT